MKEEVKAYMAVVESLRKETEVIEGNIATEAKTNKMLVSYTDGKKDELASITKKNLRLSYEIEDLSEKLELLKLSSKGGNQKSLFLTEPTNSSLNIPGNKLTDVAGKFGILEKSKYETQ